MNGKNYKLLIMFLFLFFSFFISIDSVKAEKFNCENDQYQCISCTYTIKPTSGVVYNYTFYAKTDAEGNVGVVGEGDSIIKTTIDTGYFQGTDPRNNKYKLKCPDMYYQFQVGTNYSTNYVLSYKRLSDFYFQGTAHKSTLVIADKKSNNKPFGSDNASENITTCDTVIMYEQQASQTETTYLKSNDKAVVSVNNGTINVSKLPDDMKLKDNPISSTISTDDYASGCPNNNEIIVLCKKIPNSTDSIKYECGINKATDVEVTKSGIQYYQINDPTDLNKIISTTDYELTCEDVEQLHLVWMILWIGAPALVIIMGTVDYFKAIVADDAEAMKKSKKKFPKRLIALIVLVFTPAIITVIVNFVYAAKKSDNNQSTNDNSKLSDVSLMYCIINGNK